MPTDKEVFLSDQDVGKFLDYFKRLVHGEWSFQHCYKVDDPKWKGWIKRQEQLPSFYRKIESSESANKPVYKWCIDNIRGAFDGYFWPVKGGCDTDVFKCNKIVLDGLSKEIKGNLKNNDEYKLFAACVKILEWGGVYKGSVSWLLNALEEKALVHRINMAVKYLDGMALADMEQFGSRGELRMDSGLTKIYSLASESSVIYDGRVGAALCLLVRKHFEGRKVPGSLQFKWGGSQAKKKNGKDKRDPSTDGYKFKKLPNNSYERAVLNLRANWLLEAALPEGELWGYKEKIDKLRALEAALFMIGSSVNG